MNAVTLLQLLIALPEPFVSEREAIVQRFRGTFSTWGEDLAIFSILEELAESGKFDFEKKGIYLDIGAWHPYTLSNTFLFYLMGWRGVNVEANKSAMPLFEKFRPGDRNVNACVASKKRTVTYHRFKSESCNTTYGNTAALQSGEEVSPYEFVGAETLETVEINELLNEVVGDEKIDFLDLDIEGMDEEVLTAMDFQRYRPIIVAAELSPARVASTEFKSFLNTIDYRYHSLVGGTTLFLRNDL